MTSAKPFLTGRLIQLPHERFIVSKADLEGRITYANRVFMDICGYSEEQLIGKPHSILRHPDVPHCVFMNMWETIKRGDEFFGYIKNRCSNGDHYWVMAYVVAEKNAADKVIGYTSFRRALKEGIVAKIEPIYARLRQDETAIGPRQAWDRWMNELRSQGMHYEQFVLDLHGGSLGGMMR